MRHIQIPQYIAEALFQQAREELPHEACGLLTGRDERVEKHYPMVNVDHSAEHFSFDPQEQFDVLKAARATGQKILANYHSHPSSPARPSKEDIRLAYDPSVVYIIVSLAAETPDIKAFHIRNGEAVSIPIILSEDIYWS
ncbi:MAG: M67 family metallopeptidase [Tannerellaceae bacterium]|jgi:proteasome lid subunit RPN8/RPN11|nr:M67 family metallopeptidase [Tannerellaceae bacterium]